MNYYEKLKIPATATLDEIKKSYRKLAKEYHPDKNPDADTKLKFQEIQEAYSVLSDETKRQQYDNPHSQNSSTLEDMLRAHGFNFQQGSGFAHDFNVHFGDFRNNPNAKGQDIRVNIPITIQEIYTGFSRSINLGTGNIDINIPKGARDGARYKMASKGQPNPFNSNAPLGDLIININIRYDENLIIQGDDIMIERFVKFYDMILGTNLEIELPTGKISVKIPPNTSPGKILRVPGKGLPIFGTEQSGALLISMQTNFQNLTEEQISLINRIKEINNK